jgi:rhodanese-related sulfurtransferase
MNFPVRSISAETLLSEQRTHADTVLIDVRTLREVEQDKIQLEALHLDFLDTGFETSVELLDRFNPYILICDTGKRSRMACEWMASKGFMLVSWLQGGKSTLDQLT